MKLRNAGIEKSGRTYDFETKAKADEVVKSLQSKKAKDGKKKAPEEAKSGGTSKKSKKTSKSKKGKKKKAA